MMLSDSKLSKFGIIHLLGKPIGYRALKNRVQALWNPVGVVCLIDIDNDHYLIRFAITKGYEKILTGGRGLCMVVTSLLLE
ncbi:hypothetical protein GQ457_04G019310 [Hibiscus cannabinus]